ncbi:OmpA family protein [Rhizobium lemnae]|uniref:OmpA family protein n=1 Tax=Rhizobium lemnae TaxID=1214924 RepID=A0ABV8EAU4_9HYPH|nr:OmpA family protein [Rhizobium lemnae]MCJ8506836.1 OmpA family protein [Rhizobium lemnae]
MPKRTRLLASVAMPLISISLLAPSVHAAMPGIQVPAQGIQSDIIHVQAPPPGPEGAAGEEEQKKRRPPPEAQGGGPRGEPEQPRGAQGGARPERPAAEPQAEPQAEAPARAAPEPKTGQPKAEQPKAEQPRAEQPKPEAKPEPQREPKPQGDNPPRREPKAAEPAPAERPALPAEPAQRAAPPAEPAQRPSAERPAGERPAGERPAGERPRNDARPETRPGEAPQGQAPQGQAPQGEPGRPAPAERPAAPPAAGAQPPVPPVPPAAPPADPPVAPPAAQPPAAPAPGQPPVAPGQRSDAPAVAPAPGQAAGQAAGQPPVAASPTTPQEIERAKAIANNPAQAQGPVVLPVQNGAAVLDSAKEAPAAAAAPSQPGAPGAPGQRQDGQRRDGQRPGMPPAPGQAQAPAPAPTAPPPPPPTSDAAAQAAAPGGQPAAPVRIESFSRVQGERLRERPRFEDPRGWDDVRRANDGRVIIQFDNRTFVRHDDSERFISDGYRPEYDRLPGGRTREIYERDGGVQIVTIRNRYGDVVQRSRVGRDGREIILFYAPELADERADRDYRWRDPGAELPPMRLTIPVNQYIIDTTSDPDRDYYRFLEQPPVERVERVYSVDEVRYSARIRDKVRRIDLDTVTFATGSADIPMNQASSLRKVADAIKKVLDRDPSETFLIEGHTDAVGSDESNLVLSDRRAESVARVLTDAFGIPPENMVTQGYGERYLKVATQGPEQQNRRVTIRRITALVKPVAQNR